MTGVLHLLARDHDLQTARSVSALRGGGGGGGGGSGRHAASTLRTIGRGGDYGNAVWAILGLRRELARSAVAHAWDARALTAAAVAGARRVVFTAPPALTPQRFERLRRVTRGRDVHVVCSSAPQHRAFAAAGTPAERCHLIRPPVAETFARATGSPAAEMRGRLGIGAGDFVLLAPGESTRAAAHERAAWAGSILHVTDERYRVLIWGRGARSEVAVSLAHKLRQPSLVIDATRVLGRGVEFEELIPAADAALVTARGAVPALPLALAMAARLPVVAAANTVLAELLADGETAWTIPDAAPRELAQRVLDVRADPQQARRVAGAAAERVRALFAAEHFLASYARLYDAVGV